MEGATGDTFLMRPTVGKIVAAKAPYFNKEQQLSTSDAQQVQYQSLGNNKSQQGSIRVRIWFDWIYNDGSQRAPSKLEFYEDQDSDERSRHEDYRL